MKSWRWRHDIEPKDLATGDVPGGPRLRPSRAGQSHHSLHNEVGVLDPFREAHPEFLIAAPKAYLSPE
jgi:hypothetical protein